MKKLSMFFALFCASCMVVGLSSCKEKKAEEPQKEEAAVEAIDANESMTLSGTIDKYPITMELSCEGSDIKGSYYYTRSGKKVSEDLQLKGTIDEDGRMELFEWVESDGTHSGHFLGYFTPTDGYKGKFDRSDGKEMTFNLTVENLNKDAKANQKGFSHAANKDFSFAVQEVRNAAPNHTWFDTNDNASSSYDDDEGDASFSSNSSSGSEDWDAILDAYDRYVTKYISYVNKAANGDMTAMAECASMMQEANDLAEKLQNAKGELSSAQVARYTKIMNKMASAAQKLQKLR